MCRNHFEIKLVLLNNVCYTWRRGLTNLGVFHSTNLNHLIVCCYVTWEWSRELEVNGAPFWDGKRKVNSAGYKFSIMLMCHFSSHSQQLTRFNIIRRSQNDPRWVSLYLSFPSHQSVSSALVIVMASPGVWLQIVPLHHVSTLCTSRANAALNARKVRWKK